MLAIGVPRMSSVGGHPLYAQPSTASRAPRVSPRASRSIPTTVSATCTGMNSLSSRARPTRNGSRPCALSIMMYGSLERHPPPT